MTDLNSGAVEYESRQVFGPFDDTETASEFANCLINERDILLADKVLGRSDRNLVYIEGHYLVTVKIRLDKLIVPIIVPSTEPGAERHIFIQASEETGFERRIVLKAAKETVGECEPEGKTEETPTSDGGDCSVEFEPDAEAPEEA